MKYCVAVNNAKQGSEQSKSVYSDLVSVTYTDPTVPTQQPDTPGSGNGNENGNVPLITPAPTPTPSRDNESGLKTSIIFFAITGALALIALVGIVIFLRKSKGEE